MGWNWCLLQNQRKHYKMRLNLNVFWEGKPGAFLETHALTSSCSYKVDNDLITAYAVYASLIPSNWQCLVTFWFQASARWAMLRVSDKESQCGQKNQFPLFYFKAGNKKRGNGQSFAISNVKVKAKGLPFTTRWVSSRPACTSMKDPVWSWDREYNQ